MAGWQSRIAAGVSVAAVAFGSLAPAAAIRAPFAPPADVGGRVWLDVNGDGRWGGLAEPGLAGISVALRNATGTELATTETGQDGVYQLRLRSGRLCRAGVAARGHVRNDPQPAVDI